MLKKKIHMLWDVGNFSPPEDLKIKSKFMAPLWFEFYFKSR